MAIASGQTIEQYTILSEIGRGGMATVYRASQDSIGPCANSSSSGANRWRKS